MQASTGIRVAGIAALGIGAATLLAACAGSGGKGQAGEGPMSDLTNDLMHRIHPGPFRSGVQLDVATQAVLQVKGETGAVRGSYDGTRLLQAADAHRYGTPAILDPAKDVKGDGTATFNEVRGVVRHFDTDGSLALDVDEFDAFEREVGIRWVPA